MKKVLANLNYPLLILMVVYAIFGTIMIFSASNVAAVLRYQVPTNYFFIRQILWLILGFLVGIIALFIPTDKYKYFSKLAMGGIIALLCAVFIVGSVGGGAQSWYTIGIANFQPTELSKIVLIVYLAVYYQKVNRMNSKGKMTFWDLFKPLIYVCVMFLLIAKQPDLGGASIILIIAALVFLSLPYGKKQKMKVYEIAFVGIGILAFTLLLFGKNIIHSYQVSRVLNFTNPCQRYADDTGYQVCNGYIAIHNGGLTGVGLGNSSQKYLYLPEAHTDFIFPIICEELGLLVGIVVVIGYFIMLFIILNIAKETKILRNSILAYGVFAYFLAHILINLMGVLGLIPLTGVPLPFLSYGGSYNICVVIALFIVQRVNYENRMVLENQSNNKVDSKKIKKKVVKR